MSSELLRQPGGQLPPLVLTYRQLRRAVWPVIQGYTWAQDTLWDLWQMGTPMPPQFGATATEPQRLILPSALGTWLEDVLNRQGRPLDDAAKLYNKWVTTGAYQS